MRAADGYRFCRSSLRIWVIEVKEADGRKLRKLMPKMCVR